VAHPKLTLAGISDLTQAGFSSFICSFGTPVKLASSFTLSQGLPLI